MVTEHAARFRKSRTTGMPQCACVPRAPQNSRMTLAIGSASGSFPEYWRHQYHLSTNERLPTSIGPAASAESRCYNSRRHDAACPSRLAVEYSQVGQDAGTAPHECPKLDSSYLIELAFGDFGPIDIAVLALARLESIPIFSPGGLEFTILALIPRFGNVARDAASGLR
jgi:hypothetical protein